MTTASVHVRNLSKTFVLHNQGGAELAVLGNATISVSPGGSKSALRTASRCPGDT